MGAITFGENFMVTRQFSERTIFVGGNYPWGKIMGGNFPREQLPGGQSSRGQLSGRASMLILIKIFL